jgi:hypothetical protein
MPDAMKRTPPWVFVAAVGVQLAALGLCLWAMELHARAEEQAPTPPGPPPPAPPPEPEARRDAAFAPPEPEAAPPPPWHPDSPRKPEPVAWQPAERIVRQPAPERVPEPAAEAAPDMDVTERPKAVVRAVDLPRSEIPRAEPSWMEPPRDNGHTWTEAPAGPDVRLAEPPEVRFTEPPGFDQESFGGRSRPAVVRVQQPPQSAPLFGPPPERPPEAPVGPDSVPPFITDLADETTQIVRGRSDLGRFAFGFYPDGNIRFVDFDGGRYAGKAESARARMREVDGTRAFTVQIGVAADGRLQASFTGGPHDTETVPLEPHAGWSAA